jgi:hypothetical protein
MAPPASSCWTGGCPPAECASSSMGVLAAVPSSESPGRSRWAPVELPLREKSWTSGGRTPERVAWKLASGINSQLSKSPSFADTPAPRGARSTAVAIWWSAVQGDPRLSPGRLSTLIGIGTPCAASAQPVLPITVA